MSVIQYKGLVMSVPYSTLAEARATAHSDQMSLIRSLASGYGFDFSNWEGEHLISYIFQKRGKFFTTRPAPADLSTGYLVDPEGALFSGKDTVLNGSELEGLAAIVVAIRKGWREAEIGFRVIFQMWAEDYHVPVYVRVASDRNPWHSIIWEHTATGCREIGPEGAEPCDIQENRFGL